MILLSEYIIEGEYHNDEKHPIKRASYTLEEREGSGISFHNIN